ncbi:MAG: SIMPL domain-containing protein [Patescibacteria group bacterium]
MNNETLLENKRVIQAVFSLLIMASLFLAAKFISELKSYSYIGGMGQSNVISVSGEGEVFAVPDIATISFSIRHEGKTVADTQKEVNKRVDTALKFLKDSGVAEKDIKTISYNALPQYQYYDVSCTAIGCPKPGKRVLSGYEVAQTVSVKIRDTEKAGAIVDGLGKAGTTDISGPEFSIDDDQALRAEARKKAIDDARAKAEVLADDLGVRLVRIVSFSEGGGYPIYYSKAMGMGGDAESVPAQLPKGENKITSSVTISYEIR